MRNKLGEQQLSFHTVLDLAFSCKIGWILRGAQKFSLLKFFDPTIQLKWMPELISHILHNVKC